MSVEVRRPVEDWESPLLTAFGAKLRNFRTAVGATQQELAVRAGLSRRHVIRLEKGERRPRASTIRRLTEALGRDDSSLPPGDRSLPATAWMTKELIGAVGAALAPESAHRDRIERRRDRKARRDARALEEADRLAVIALDEALEIAPILADQMFEHKVRRHEEAKRQAAVRIQKRKEGLVPARPRRGTQSSPSGTSR